MTHPIPASLSTLALALCVAFPAQAQSAAAETETSTALLPRVEITDSALNRQDAGAARRLGVQRASSSDAASLLQDSPGVSLQGAGGVSSLPSIHGLADDRLRIKVDGMDLISACANHMNPPLSYIDPSNVSSLKVFAGIAPVSLGGDSIGGTIAVTSAAPEFAQAGQGLLHKGELGAFYRSNGKANGAHLALTLANEQLSLSVGSSSTQSDDFSAGATFKAAGTAATGRAWLDGDVVGSSRYKSENQTLALALRHDQHLIELKLGAQNIPYQGFPNQRMDMVGNDSSLFTLHYSGKYAWGDFEARAYHEETRHSMNFGPDKQFAYGMAPGMPMDTRGNNSGAHVQAQLTLSQRDTLTLGGDVQRYRLNDWWSPSGTGAMMAPNTFWNIRDGQRDRLDVFAEWDARWSRQWVSQLGARSAQVRMNTGAAQGYSSMMYPATSYAAFNAAQRARIDYNLDLTALARFTPNEQQSYEAGYARKSRSPNLYERYTWSTNNTMVMNMNNWVGDGNGYVGNLNLRPEVADTLSATGRWHDAAHQLWGVEFTPFYTRVSDYVDAVACSAIGKTCPARTDGFVNLSLANQAARLYGVDISGQLALGAAGGYGSLLGRGQLNAVNGKNLSTGAPLYNIMPLNVKLALEHHLGPWTNTLEVKWVDAKTQVHAVRKELATNAYSLLNLRSSYEWRSLRIDAGVENLLNASYVNPLGGAYVGQGATMGTGVHQGAGVPGIGRSAFAAASVKF